MKSLISILKLLSIILIITEFASVQSKLTLKFLQAQSCPKDTNFFHDDFNCGSCGNKCGRYTRCYLGACVCTEGFKKCGDSCLDTLTNPDNCGNCGTKCTLSGEICSAGACACKKDFSKCDNGCFDLKTDEQNCGKCGSVCKDGYDCIEGACLLQTGAKICDNVVKIINSDAQNCGDCGTKCAADQVCLNAACTCAPITIRKTISVGFDITYAFDDTTTIPLDTGCKRWSVNIINHKFRYWIDNIRFSLTDKDGNDNPTLGLIRGGNGGTDRPKINLNNSPIERVIIYKNGASTINGLRFVARNKMAYEVGNIDGSWEEIVIEEGEKIIGAHGKTDGALRKIGFIVYK
jgi:hypothetical protein